MLLFFIFIQNSTGFYVTFCQRKLSLKKKISLKKMDLDIGFFLAVGAQGDQET